MFLRDQHDPLDSDEALFARLRTGGRKPLAALWDRYAHLLFGVAMKYLKDTERAKDLVMEAFADLPALSAKHQVTAFRPWVHSVVRNRCLMLLRKADPHVALDPAQLAQEPETGDAVLREASLQALEQAINGLPADQASCIRLFYLQRNSYQQVAAATGFTLEQVRSHLQNGRRNLRNSLTRHGIRP